VAAGQGAVVTGTQPTRPTPGPTSRECTTTYTTVGRRTSRGCTSRSAKLPNQGRTLGKVLAASAVGGTSTGSCWSTGVACGPAKLPTSPRSTLSEVLLRMSDALLVDDNFADDVNSRTVEPLVTYLRGLSREALSLATTVVKITRRTRYLG
jgi:hypothetical protein